MHGLSARLRALFDAVPAGASVADVCADHAQLAIALVESGRVARAVAIDLRAAPLAQAQATVDRRGLSALVQLRQGDGLTPLDDGEANCIVIAGIGGRLADDILKAGHPAGIERLIVQVNRRQELVRRRFAALDFGLVDEQLTHCQGRDFVTMVGDRSAGDLSADYDANDWRWGPCLLARKDPGLKRVLVAAHQRCSDQLAGARARGANDLGHLRAELAGLELALERVATG